MSDTQHKRHFKKFSLFIAVLILLIGILVGGYLVLKSGRGSASQLADILSGKSTTLQACEPNPGDANKDADNDGLKDWQEVQIYKSDPCKPDTDGDGYLDGEEVASGYDPTKKAPGDELPGTTPKTPRPLPENLTEALRQNLADQLNQNKLSAFNSQGGLLSSDELANYPAVQASIQDIIASSGSLFAPDKIDDNEIKTTADNSQAAIQKYAAAASTAMASVVPQEAYKITNSESQIFLNAIEENDFSELDLVQKVYQDTYENFKKLTVPSDMLSLHKEQLNIISSLIKIYQAVKEIDTDPLKANLALQAYESLRNQFANWLQELSQFIKDRT